MIIEEAGLRCRGPNEEAFVAWNGIRAIEELDGQILVYLDDISFMPIPASAFSDSAERAEFLADLHRRSCISKHPTKSTSFAQTSQSEAANETLHQGQRSPANLYANVMQGLRLAFFLRPKIDGPPATGASWSTIVALLLLSIALSFLVNRLQVGPKGFFSATGLPGVLFGLPVMMVGAWALALLTKRTGQTLALLIALTSLAIPIDLIEILFHPRFANGESSPTGVPHFIFPVWLMLASSVAAIRLLDVPRRRWPLAILLIGLLVTLPLRMIDRNRTLWFPSFDEEADKYERARDALANEEVFYLQPKLLEQQLAAVKAGRRGVIDLYFIGLAAYAEQDVFMREVQSVTKLFDERFDTAGRSLMLINNPATVHKSPIASATSLGLALQRVAEVMNRDEDILFLFITSHGSTDHKATFQFSPIQLHDLDPERLKQLLDQFGFKRRVVVVSACYSGAFVDVLKDDGTLVIAASAADKNSFGCSNDADFTYFGEAYFDEALRRTYSFAEAFEMARPVIAERERKANFVASDPRMFVGAGIKQALEEFVRLRQTAVKRASVKRSSQHADRQE